MTRAGATIAVAALLASASAMAAPTLGSVRTTAAALPAGSPVAAADGQVATPEPLVGPLAALVVLADTRAPTAWPAIVAQIGTTLPSFEAALRQVAVAIRAALADSLVPRTGLIASRANQTQWTGLNPEIEVRLQLVRVLAVIDFDAALAELTAIEANSVIGNGDGGSRVRVFLHHAGLLAGRGYDAEADAVLARASTLFPPGSDRGINVDVNAAALAAERGQPQAALALLDRAGDPYAHRMANRTSGVIRSGAVQYLWIRACAYQQLGRVDEAAALMRALAAEPAASPPIRERAALIAATVFAPVRSCSIRAAIVLAAAFATPASAASALHTSFACARATSASERAICASPTLAALDREVARAYARVALLVGEPGDPEPPARLRASQRAWLAGRDRCGGTVDCLAARMRARLTVLDMRADPARPQPTDAYVGRYARTSGSVRVVALTTATALVRVDTVSPGAMGLCDLTVLARVGPQGASLTDAETGARVGTMRARPNAIEVEQAPEGDAPALCGVGATIAGTYRHTLPR